MLATDLFKENGKLMLLQIINYTKNFRSVERLFISNLTGWNLGTAGCWESSLLISVTI
jgi:hypothetical protein